MSLKGRHEPAALAVRQPESGHSSEMPRADFGQCELSAKTPLYGQVSESDRSAAPIDP